MTLSDATLARFDALLVPVHLTRREIIQSFGKALFFVRFFSPHIIYLDNWPCPKPTRNDYSERQNTDYAERRNNLHALLRALPESVDVDRVYDALEEAQLAKCRACMDADSIDRRRRFEQDKKILRIARRIRGEYLLDPDPKLDALLQHKWEGPTRRAGIGHQAQPWLKLAKAKLAQAGVPKWRATELLVLLGLSVEYKKKDWWK